MNKIKEKNNFFTKNFFLNNQKQYSYHESTEKQIEFTDFILIDVIKIKERIDGEFVSVDYYEVENYIYDLLYLLEENYTLTKEIENTLYLYVFIIGLSVELLQFKRDEEIVKYLNNLFFIMDKETIYTAILLILDKEYLSGKTIVLANQIGRDKSLPLEILNLYNAFKRNKSRFSK